MDLPRYDPDDINVGRAEKAKSEAPSMLDSVLNAVGINPEHLNPLLLMERLARRSEMRDNYEKWSKRKRTPDARVADSKMLEEIEKAVQEARRSTARRTREIQSGDVRYARGYRG